MSAAEEVVSRRLFGRESELGASGPIYDFLKPDTQALPIEQYLPKIGRVGQFITTGARVYKDNGDHMEYAGPECQTVTELLAADYEMQVLLDDLTVNINKARETGVPVRLNTRVVDDTHMSWGSHENYNVPREIDPELDLVHDTLASHLVTRSVFTGVGQVLGYDDNRRSYDYSATQKMRRVGSVTSTGTTSEADKPIVNLRDRPHGNRRRIHIICGDPTMTPWATAIAFGTTSIVLRMLEHNVPGLADLALENPVGAARIVSDDLELEGTVRLANGKEYRPYEVQRALAQKGLELAERGLLSEEEVIIAHEWYEATEDAEVDPDRLADRVEWVAKMQRADRFLDDDDLDPEERKKQVIRVDKAWGELGIKRGIARQLVEKDWFRDPLGAIALSRANPGFIPEGRAALRAGVVKAVTDNRHKAGVRLNDRRVRWDLVTAAGSTVELKDEFGEKPRERDQAVALVDRINSL